MMPRVIAGLIVILFLSSCESDRLDVDISDVSIPEVKLQRLDKDFFALTEPNFEKESREIKQRYRNFYEHYLASFLTRGGSDDTTYKASVLKFINDKDVRNCYNQTLKIYSDEKLNHITTDVNDCVKRFHYHFPHRKLPARLITCLTGWNFATAYTDSALVIGTDMYLGDTSIYYQMLHLPQYRTHYMTEPAIVPDLVRGWMITEFDNADVTNNLLNHTIFYGKIYYAVNALLPQIQDSLLMSYTETQLKYCKENEKNLWGYFAEKNRLYENNMKAVQELITEGPFTAAISKECPPRIAMWVGLQIVRSYMDKNDVSLEELMSEKDAQKILSKSKYRP